MIDIDIMKCPICWEDSEVTVRNYCGHTCCKKCMNRYILSLWEIPWEHSIPCWGFKCKSKLSKKKIIKKVLSKGQFEHFLTLSKQFQRYKAKEKKFKIKDTRLTSIEKENQTRFIMLAHSKGWKQCPGCGIFVEKISTGCNLFRHDKCSGAGFWSMIYDLTTNWGFTEFCFRCGSKKSQCNCYYNRDYRSTRGDDLCFMFFSFFLGIMVFMFLYMFLLLFYTILTV